MPLRTAIFTIGAVAGIYLGARYSYHHGKASPRPATMYEITNRYSNFIKAFLFLSLIT